MKLKTIALATLLGIAGFAKAQSLDTVDLSTGVVNGTNTLIAPTVNDDTWKVAVPGSGTYVNVKCTNGSVISGTTVYTGTWASTSAARWLSPYIDGTGNATELGPTGNYYYKMTFTSKACIVNGATLNLYNFGGDNNVTDIQINTTHHALSATFNPLSSTTITLSPSEIVSGTNTIYITVNNQMYGGHNTFTGLFVSGNIVIDHAADPNLIASVAGANTFCGGSNLTFTGSDGPSTALNHFWEIVECNSSGVPTGGYSWSSWYSGTPGTFTFPNSSTIPCGKYYRVKLAVQNNCTGWNEATKIIYINCPPVANAGPDVTICNGSCATIGTTGNPTSGYTYNWTYFNDQPWNAGSGQTISVCPTASFPYTLTVTNTTTGCKATDVVNVNVENNDPRFNLATNLNATDNFYTCNGNPIITNVSGIPGFGFSWIVEELVSSSNTTVISGSQVVNSNCWWASLSCNYNGYDGPYFTSTGGNPMHLGCGNPVQGKFTAGHTYRITRGTWSNTCPWQQYSVIVYMTHAMSGQNIQVVEDNSAPDYSGLVLNGTTAIEENNTDQLSIYPNPANGIFNIETGSGDKATIEVIDMLGQLVKSYETTGKSTLVLTGYPKGIYLVKMNINGKQVSKKIIFE